MVRIKASDPEGRYLEPFLSFLVMNLDVEIRLENWGGRYIERESNSDECSYIEFDDPELATAFSLRWSNAVFAEN